MLLRSRIAIVGVSLTSYFLPSLSWCHRVITTITAVPQDSVRRCLAWETEPTGVLRGADMLTFFICFRQLSLKYGYTSTLQNILAIVKHQRVQSNLYVYEFNEASTFLFWLHTNSSILALGLPEFIHTPSSLIWCVQIQIIKPALTLDATFGAPTLTSFRSGSDTEPGSRLLGSTLTSYACSNGVSNGHSEQWYFQAHASKKKGQLQGSFYFRWYHHTGAQRKMQQDTKIEKRKEREKKD